MKKPTKKEEQRQHTTETILACALDLFVGNGYRATTIDVIAAKAGVTKGAIYFYFRTKEAILLTLLEQAEEYVVAPIESHLAEAGPKADDKFVRFIHSQSQLGVTRPQHVLLLILVSIEFRGAGNDIEARVRAIYRRLYGHIEQIIQLGQSQGIFRRDLASPELTAVVMAGHDGVLIEWYRRPDELTGRKLARALRATLLNGLLQRPA